MFTYPYSPFQLDSDTVRVPKKYEDVLGSSFSFSEWEKNQAKLISSYWLNEWYDDSLPTPKTQFYTFEQFKKLKINCNEHFVRLNSLSLKEKTESCPKKFIQQCKNSSRCADSFRIGRLAEADIYVCVRELLPIEEGNEFRLFVFEDKLVAIGSIDDKIVDMDDEELVKRSRALLDQIYLPVCDAVVDVWLNDKKDQIVELNSYGYWGNSYHELFDWHADWYTLYGYNDKIDIRRVC